MFMNVRPISPVASSQSKGTAKGQAGAKQRQSGLFGAILDELTLSRAAIEHEAHEADRQPAPPPAAPKPAPNPMDLLQQEVEKANMAILSFLFARG